MDGFFDYAIADEVHELKGGDTAQGNALGTLAAAARHIAVLTGTLLGGYPDRPYGFGDLIGREFNPETQRREPFLIAATRDLDENFVYAKERRLVEEIKSSIERGRKVQVYAVYTQKRDVTRRLESILTKEGIRVAVLTTQVAPEEREAWYERQLRAGIQVVIGHPRWSKQASTCCLSRTSSSMRPVIPFIR
jgi:hypothetical protein